MMEIMDSEERRKKLSKIARNEFSRQLHANDVINAIDTLNKMDNLYKLPVETHEIVRTFVFLLPDGTKFIPGLPPQLATPGEVKLLPEAPPDTDKGVTGVTGRNIGRNGR